MYYKQTLENLLPRRLNLLSFNSKYRDRLLTNNPPPLKISRPLKLATVKSNALANIYDEIGYHLMIGNYLVMACDNASQDGGDITITCSDDKIYSVPTQHITHDFFIILDYDNAVRFLNLVTTHSQESIEDKSHDIMLATDSRGYNYLLYNKPLESSVYTVYTYYELILDKP